MPAGKRFSGEWIGAAECLSCGQRVGPPRPLDSSPWRILAVTSLILNVAWGAVLFVGAELDARMLAAVERADEAAVAAVVSSRAAAATPPARPPPNPGPLEPLTQWPVGLGILKVGESEFLVDRRVIEVALRRQTDVIHRARIVPDSEDGKIKGIRLLGVRPGSLLARLGLENGDRVESIDGIDLSTPDRALQAYERLGISDDVSVTVSRRGSRMKIEYHML